MTRSAKGRSLRLAFGAAAVATFGAAALAQPAPILIGNDREHPESITSGPDGTLYIGLMGKSAVYRVPPGAAAAEPFITEGLNTVTGVFASGGDLWVCSSAAFGEDAPTYANVYDRATGTLRASYEFPGGGFCNDFAVGRDGTVFVSDTVGGRILALHPGATELTVFHEDEDLLAGVDGLAILDGELMLNSVTTSRIFQIDITPTYGFGAINEFTPTQPIEAPDGMRTLPDDRGLLMVEGDRLVRVTLTGRTAHIEVLQEGFSGATAVTVVGDTAYVVEGKLTFLFDTTLGDPGAFNVTPVPIPPLP